MHIILRSDLSKSTTDSTLIKVVIFDFRLLTDPIYQIQNDLIKKALRKLPGEALRNEIDVTEA